KIPASTPLTQVWLSGDSGVTVGSVGTVPAGGLARMPASNPERKSCSPAVSVAGEGSGPSAAASASTGDWTWWGTGSAAAGGVEAVELGDRAGLGHGVPVMRQPDGGEHQRKLVVGQLGCGQVRPRQKPGATTRRREGQRGHRPVGVSVQILTDTVVAVADRIS